MVKPMPASKPVHNKCLRLISVGIEHKPIAAPATENKNIPNGFPTNNPKIIP